MLEVVKNVRDGQDINNYCSKTIHSYISTTAYSEVLIYTAERTGHRGDNKNVQASKRQ